MYTSSIVDSLRLQREEGINNITYDLDDSRDVRSYWLTKEWIATVVYLKWMRNSAYYIENLSHSSIYWFFIFWFIEIHLRIEIFVCHENFFFWSSYLRSSLSLRFDLIRIAYSFSNSLISRRSRKSINLKEIISIEWL